MPRRRLIAAMLVTLAALHVACQTNEKIVFVNPTETPLFVTVNGRAPFAVAPGASASAPVPALERLRPVTITARNESGATVFFLTTSLPRLLEQGRRVEMAPNGDGIDPLADPALAPYLPPTPAR